MTIGRWNSRNRITKEIREQILYAYLGDPIKGTELAMSNGLTAAYAYKLAYERGLLPTRDEKLLGRSHSSTATKRSSMPSPCRRVSVTTIGACRSRCEKQT